MRIMSKKNELLPPGFADTLAPIAALESRIVTLLMKNMASFGYIQVKPPIVEFEDSLLDGADSNINQQTFRVVDPESNETLAIRADMTTQIARIASTRLKDDPRPLRISYAGQVLRVKGEGLYTERQLAQAGAELIGVDTPEADAEILIAAAQSLKRAGVDEISIDISLPTLPSLMGANEKLRAALANKEKASIKSAAGKNFALYESLLSSFSPAALKNLKSVDLPEEVREVAERLEKTTAIIKDSLPKVKITMDLLEHRGFEYYTGFSFSIFSTMTDEELGRGGRYTIGKGGETSAGFSLSVNAIMRALPKKRDKEKIYIPLDTPISKSKKAREQGLVAIHAVDDSDPIAEAKKLGCKYILKDGKTKSI